MNVRYRVELSQTERDELKALLSGGKQAALREEPRPRMSTEMRPSMPARKRWPCLNAADLS